MFKTVIFDLGKVIVPFDLQRGYAALQPLCGISVEEIRKRIVAAGIVGPFESGQIEPEDFVRRFSGALGIELGYDRFCELWGCIFLPETLIPEELLIGLKKHYRLLLLSNTNAIHFEVLRRNYPILRHFDKRILSHEVGAMKPDPRIYQAAIESAGCRPEECFFIDDIQEFVDGARRAGIDAVRFESAAQLEQEFDARGIVWRTSPKDEEGIKVL